MTAVAIVYRLDRPGGVQSCAISLIKGLNCRGIVPDVLWDVPPDPALLRRLGLQAGFMPLAFPIPTRMIDRLPDSLRYLAWIANVVDEKSLPARYDFYYIFYNGFLVSENTPHVRYLSGPPLLPQLEGIPPGAKGIPYRVFRWIYQRGFRRARPAYEFHRNDHYVINSHYTASLFAEAHGVSLPVVHPPIHLAGRSFSLDDLPLRDTLTFFSRVVDYKRPEMVLELAYRHPGLRCVIMGSVAPHRRLYFADLQEQARRAGREDIVFLDTPSDERVRAELKRTRFYVFPARNEHFGMATPEAIASGAIPFVHDSGGQREIVPDDRLRFQDGEYYTKFSALVQASDADLNQMRSALAVHVQRFSEDIYIQKMLNFLAVPDSGEE